MISERILVIDDDERVIKSLRMILTQYKLVEFTDGNKALKYLQRSHPFSLALVDVMMPEIDGLEVLRKIKVLRKDISVIIMTAYATKDVALQALRSHADDFIEKPFDPHELIEKVSKFLKGSAVYPKKEQTKTERIEKIKKYIKKNFDKVSLNTIAQEACLSSKYISRIFKELDGVTFREFLIDLKIREARSLLTKTKISVERISYRLGYQNPESFMRIFKKRIGKTPSEFRKNVQS